MALRFAAVSSASCTPHLPRTSSNDFLNSSPSRLSLPVHGLGKSRLLFGAWSARPCPSCSTASANGSLRRSALSESSDSSPTSGFYTSMKDNHLRFWDTHDALQSREVEDAPSTFCHADELLLAELRLLSNVAADRTEIHAILAQQRDNWNKLFQSTLTMATMTATVLAGLDGLQHSSSLSLPAFILNAGCAFMMAVINQFQPSQLAEEQRSASRLFKKLANDIGYALSVSPALRQGNAALLRDSRSRVQALDRAYPLPLSPGGLEKFPTRVPPPVLSDQPDASAPVEATPCEVNGWNESVTRELLEVATLLHDSDIKTYSTWAQNVVKVNKGLAIVAPVFALCGAALNAVNSFCWNRELGMLAALCSVLAAFAGSFSHDMQLGMVFELYRNSAGYYGEVEATIARTLRSPAKERENGVLFHRRVSYELGRSGEEGLPLLPPDAKKGGALF